MRQFIVLVFLYFSCFSLRCIFAQNPIEGKYTSNVDSPIDSSTMNEIMTVEIETDFKTKFDTIYHDIETKLNIYFLPKSGSHLLLIKESAIEKIKDEFAMKFILFFYEDKKGSINTIDSLFLKLEFAGDIVYAERRIDTIKATPIKIINKCSKVKYMQFNQIQIIKAPPIVKSKIIIEECDTTYYPIKITSSPPGARIFFNNEDSLNFTPYTFVENKNPSISFKLTKNGYKPYSGTVTGLKSKEELGPEEVNYKHVKLDKEKDKDIWIFLGTTTAYGIVWYFLSTTNITPKKIPPPPKFPNPK